MNCKTGLALFLICLVAGCGGDSNPEGIALVSAKGKILVDSKPVTGLVVQLKPKFDWKSDKVPLPHAVTDKDGNFILETFKTADGAPAGEYEVSVVSPSNEGLGRISDPIGSRYADASKSGLTVKIGDQETTIPDFQLKGSSVEAKIQKSMPKK